MHAKLHAPLSVSNQVIRRHISEKVEARSISRLILIHGPAGFGKTTVMLQAREILQKAEYSTAWLTLDDADNELQRFLYFLTQAVECLSEKNGSPTATISGTGDTALDLLDMIAANGEPFAIFLDDFEMLSNAAALSLVARIVESLPPHGHLVIGARNVPAISLGRLRAKGFLMEIDSQSLRFTIDEANDFFANRGGRVLSTEQIAKLHRKSEGWVTAMSLASLGLERSRDIDSFIEYFSGSDVSIANFLVEDVLDRLPKDVREFLLKTAILTELSGSLCNAVCSIANGQEVLAKLEQESLFLIPLDNERNWYRYHNLFSDSLRTEAARRMPDAVPRLHRLAAEWYLLHGRPIPAINHALASKDMAYAVELLEEHLNSLLGQGRLRLLGRWIESLPVHILEKAPRLKIALAWSVTFTRGARAALSMVEGMDAELLPAEPQALLRALRPMLLALTDEIDEAHEQGLDAMPFIPPEHRFSYGMLAQALTNVSIIKGRFAEAHKFADQARRVQEAATGHFNIVLAESAEAIIDLMQGRLKQAAIRLSMVTDPVSPTAIRPRYGNIFSGILFAETLYEADRCEEAQRLLEVYVPLAREVAQPDTLIMSHVSLSRIVARQGDWDRALQLLTELEATGHRLDLPRIIASARLERVRLALQQGDVRNAKELLALAGDSRLWEKVSRQWFIANDTLTFGLYQARWMIQSGNATQALPNLKQELESAELGQRHRRALKIRIMMAEALHRDGQHKAAMRMLIRTLEFAATEGFVQTFIEEGAVIGELMHECASTRQGHADQATDALQTDWLERFKLQPVSSAQGIGTPAGLAEALTRKESQVLSLLAQGLSNNAISEKLFVSETTVRTHLRNVFAKLQAENRVQAVAIARRLRLIE